MKKMLFSALAIVAFVGSSFASNEVVEKVTDRQEPAKNVELLVNDAVSEPEKVEFAKTCIMNIKNKDGKVVGTVYVTDVPNNISCNSQAVKDVAVAIYVSNSH